MRKKFGLSAREVFTELPEWELALLWGEHVREEREAAKRRQGQA